MINYSQLVNGLWMGGVLILLALTPGLLDRCGEAISRFSTLLLFRSPFLQSRSAEIPQPRWLAAAGTFLILLSLLIYVAH